MQSILLSFLFISVASFSQSKTSIEGKWRIIAFSDEEMYYNIKKDSIWFSPETKEALGSATDSSIKVQALKALWKLMANSFQIFGKKGVYQEIEDDKVTGEGTFSIDKKKRKLKIILIRNNVPVTEEKYFQIYGKELHIMEDYSGTPVTLVLEKVY